MGSGKSLSACGRQDVVIAPVFHRAKVRGTLVREQPWERRHDCQRVDFVPFDQHQRRVQRLCRRNRTTRWAGTNVLATVALSLYQQGESGSVDGDAAAYVRAYGTSSQPYVDVPANAANNAYYVYGSTFVLFRLSVE